MSDIKSIRLPPPIADEMVRAIQADRKTVTRRVVKPPVMNTIVTPPLQSTDKPRMWAFYGEDGRRRAPYRPGDILYVREAFFEYKGRYYYKADRKHEALDSLIGGSFFKWRPSIHMPREAARLFLRVTDVRVQQLKDVTEADARAEGFYTRVGFITAILKMYPDCTEDSWLWVIEFERISREEIINESKNIH